ncbi:protein regulator of cytokinesis 1 [Bombus terrestris]|uniref:Protein regulator of cytokinesis 1 n=1 Tax=Bombus terrestris TaxID=30195 RepID=A0A9C6SS41_BOMTE|nr:protein regulator of cytokinesis 1 [Bombus terrestris]
MADSSEWEPLMQKITAKLSSTLTQLHEIWKEIGYNHEVRSIYSKQVFDHIEDLLGDMVSESKLKKETILVNVKDLMDQIGVLTKELGTNITNAGYENLSLKEVEEALRADLQNLQYCKTQRVTHLKKLLAKEKTLCKVLGTQPINIEEKLPSDEELKSFELYLEKQEGEKCRLEAIFNEQRRAIVRMMDDLGTSPSSSFQHIVYEDDENYVFSNSNMNKLRELREELEHKVNSAKEHVEDIRQKLIALWKYLNEPEHICQSFLSSYEGYSVATINALTTELERFGQSMGFM